MTASKPLSVAAPDPGSGLGPVWTSGDAAGEHRPQFEIAHRRLVPADGALDQLISQPSFTRGLRPLYRRMFVEAGLLIACTGHKHAAAEAPRSRAQAGDS